MQNFFTLAPQCCDAGNYLDLGFQCATNNVCYGPLRPAGDYYWFGIPYFFGVPPDVLVLLNMVLMLISVWLAVKAFLLLLNLNESRRKYQQQIRIFIVFVISLLVHGVFFYPTLFNSMSDVPASALFLCGIWLLILSAFTQNKKHDGCLLIIAGLCWGMSVWLRAFFLYPVLFSLSIYSGFWLLSKDRKKMQLVFLVALIPIGAQVFITYKAYGELSFLPKEVTSSVSYMHLNTPHAGYDTALPHGSYFWPPKNCHAELGILNGIQEKKFSDVLCVLESRAYFYLGTYKSVTYIFPGETHYLVQGSSESIGNELKNWWTNLTLSEDVELAPSGLKNADKLSVPAASPNGFGDIKQWILLKGDTTYTFSVWLWSPFPRTINLGITQYEDERIIIALQQFLLTPQPHRYFVTGRTREATLYNAYIGSISPDKPVTFGTHNGDYLFAWGAQLETSDHPTAYTAGEPINPDSIRLWSPVLLSLNIMAMVLAFGFCISRRVFFMMQAKGLTIMAGLLLCAVEAMAIIPEQRFVVVLIVFVWLLAIAGLYGLCTMKVAGNQQGGS